MGSVPRGIPTKKGELNDADLEVIASRMEREGEVAEENGNTTADFIGSTDTMSDSQALESEETQEEVGNETRTNETQQKPEQAQPVTPSTGEEARPVEAGEAPSEVGGEVKAAPILSGDEIRKSMPGYVAKNWDTHVDRKDDFVAPRMEARFQELLTTRKGKGNGEVFFLAGGNGSGKSTVAKEYGSTPDFVIDSTLGNLEVARKQIKAILDNGQKVAIDFIYRSPEQALKGVVGRVERGGHSVSPVSFAKSHTEGIKNLRLLANEFGDKISIRVHDNSVDGIPMITIDELEAKGIPDYEELRKRANEVLGKYDGRLAQQGSTDGTPESGGGSESTQSDSKERVEALTSAPTQTEVNTPTQSAEAVEGSSDASTEEKKPVSARSVIEKMTEQAPVEELPVAEVFNDDTRIPNFKEGANPETGEVEPLTGEPYDLVSNPIVVMEFKDGKKVVVTGRHRLALYKRNGRKTIAARVIKESDGWTVNDARMIDSVGNIIDEKGTVKDYVKYFEDAKPTRKAAEAGGFLSRPKGRLAFSIYEGASADTRAAIDFEGGGADGQISVEQAGIIAEAAPVGAHPRNKALQRILVGKALAGVRGKKLGILARSLAEEVKNEKTPSNVGGEMQLDLFASAEDQELLAMEDKRADYRTRKGQEYSRIAEVLRTAMSKGGKLDLNEEYARELGITDPKDKNQLAAARDKAVERANYWETAISLNEADKTAMDAEITAKADASAKKQAEVKAKAQAALENAKARREGKTVERPVNTEDASKKTARVDEKPTETAKTTEQEPEKSVEDVETAESLLQKSYSKLLKELEDVNRLLDDAVKSHDEKGRLEALVKCYKTELAIRKFEHEHRTEKYKKEGEKYPFRDFMSLSNNEIHDKIKELKISLSQIEQDSPKKSERDIAYEKWLEKFKLKDTPEHRAEWERKNPVKAEKEAPKAVTPAKTAEAPKAAKPARFEKNSQNSAKAPSIKMKDAAAEKRAQKLEDELGALFMSEELSKAVDNDIMSALSDNPTIEDVKKVIKDFINGKLSNKRFSTEDISRYIKQGGSNAERVLEAAILSERVGAFQKDSKILQGGISRIFSQSSFGWKENIISSLEGLFGDIERFNGEPIDGKDTHAVWHVGNDAYKLVRLWDGQELEGFTKQIMLNARFGERYSGDVLGGGTVDGKLYILVKQPWIEQGVSDREIVKRAINGLKKQNGVERAPDEDGYINEYSFSLNLQDDRYIYSDLNLNQNYFVTEYGEIRIIDADVTDKDIDKVVFMSEEFDLAKTQRRINNLLELVSELTDEFGTFNDVAKYFAVNYPEKFGAMKPYLRTLWNVVADQLNLPEVSKDEVAQIYADIERDGVEEKVEPKEPPANKLQSTRISDAADEIVALIEKGDKFSRKDITDIVERQLGGKVASGDFDAKQVTDILELAVNRYMQNKGTIFSPASNVGSDNAVAVINRIRHLLGIIPTHTTRSVEQDALQQFSTPPHEAFVAAWTANIKEDDVMLEPSAGIGGLAVFADIAGAKVVLNEYSPRRAEILEQLGLGKPYDHDAQYLYALLEPEVKSGKIKRPTVVVMNPPFSNSVSSGRKNTHIGAEHVEQALKLLAPGGRLVAIVGNGMAHDKPAFKDWWNRIGKEYTVRANIGISGQEYAKYGTTFDNNIIVIDKVTPNRSITPIYGKISLLDEIPAMLEGVRNDRPRVQKDSSSSVRSEIQSDSKQVRGVVLDDGISVAPTSGILSNGSSIQTERNSVDGTRNGGGRIGISRMGGDPNTQAQKEGLVAIPEMANGRGGSTVAERGTLLEGTSRPSTKRSGRIQNVRSDSNSRTGTSGLGYKSELQGLPDGNRLIGDYNGSVDGSEFRADGLVVQSVEQTREVGDGTFSEYKPSKVSVPGMKPHPTALVESSAMASVQPPNPTYSPKIPKKIIVDNVSVLVV